MLQSCPFYGRIYDSGAILFGKHFKWLLRPEGTREKPAFFLAENARFAYSDRAGMRTQILSSFAECFLLFTAALRSRHRNIVMTLDGC